MNVFQYQVDSENTFPNKKVDVIRFTKEIRESAILVALDSVVLGGGYCTITFKTDLPQDQILLLESLMFAHSGEPIPTNVLPDGTPLVAIAQRQSDGIPQIAIAPTTGSETVIASHNLCDKCSWFGDSVRVTDETLTDAGNGTLFGSTHDHWIDMVSGRVHNDDGWVVDQKVRNPTDPHGYEAIIKVGGVTQTMREPFEVSGGDYEVIWETGQVQFFVAPVGAVTASYSYATTSNFYVRPSPGKVLRILKAEVDVAMGAVMTDTVMYDIWAVVDAVAPQLMPGIPSGTMIPIGEVVYKRMGQISAEAQGAYPSIEVLGASDAELAMSLDEFRRKSRGTRSKVQALPFNYSTSRDLSAAAMMEVRVHTKHDRPFEGDTVTVTFYCVSKDEV